MSRLHDVDLSDESPIPELKFGPTPDPTTPGTPITFTSDEIDEEDFPAPPLTSPTTLEESPDERLVRFGVWKHKVKTYSTYDPVRMLKTIM